MTFVTFAFAAVFLAIFIGFVVKNYLNNLPTDDSKKFDLYDKIKKPPEKPNEKK